MALDQRIILTRGLPASGKSGWATKVARDDDRYSRVSRDDIRMMLNSTLHAGAVGEDLVTKVETESVKAVLAAGRNPIVDAMHLYQRHVNRWQRLGYPVEIVNFSVPLDELVRRNTARGETVPNAVIEKLFKKMAREDTGDLSPVNLDPGAYVTSRFEKYQPDTSRPSAVIFDIDGTLAHMTGRSPHDYSRVSEDSADPFVRDLANALDGTHAIIVVSGRKADCEVETLAWLRKNLIPFDALFMRDSKDDRPDTVVKHEILRDKIAPRYNVVGAIDDRNSVVSMWRSVGIKCLQAQEGDF